MGKAILNVKKTYRLEYYQGKDTQWYFRVVRIKNSYIVLDGAEGYASKSNVLRAIKRLKCLDFSVIEIVEG